MTDSPKERTARAWQRLGPSTPLPDALVLRLGLKLALVYGVVWRYCQRKERQCTASWDTLAKQIGVSRRAFALYLKTLIELGFIEDTTPDEKGSAHVLIAIDHNLVSDDSATDDEGSAAIALPEPNDEGGSAIGVESSAIPAGGSAIGVETSAAIAHKDTRIDLGNKETLSAEGAKNAPSAVPLSSSGEEKPLPERPELPEGVKVAFMRFSGKDFVPAHTERLLVTLVARHGEAAVVQAFEAAKAVGAPSMIAAINFLPAEAAR